MNEYLRSFQNVDQRESSQATQVNMQESTIEKLDAVLPSATMSTKEEVISATYIKEDQTAPYLSNPKVLCRRYRVKK